MELRGEPVNTVSIIWDQTFLLQAEKKGNLLYYGIFSEGGAFMAELTIPKAEKKASTSNHLPPQNPGGAKTIITAPAIP